MIRYVGISVTIHGLYLENEQAVEELRRDIEAAIKPLILNTPQGEFEPGLVVEIEEFAGRVDTCH